MTLQKAIDAATALTDEKAAERETHREDLRHSPKVTLVPDTVWHKPFTEFLDELHNRGMCVVPIRGGTAAAVAIPAGIEFDQI